MQDQSAGNEGAAFITTRGAFGGWQAPRLEIESARGCWIRERAGGEYLDFASGSGSLILGHGDRRLAALMGAQAHSFTVYPTQPFRATVVEEYLGSLVRFCGDGFSRAMTAASGTDAVEAACKLALQHHFARGDHRRSRVLGRHGSYHGNSLFALSVGAHMSRREPYERLWPASERAPAAFCRRCQFARVPQTCALECADAVEEMCRSAGPESIAAMIVEPVVGAALGGAVPDPRYIARLRQICDRHGILLIMDEVLTGFGRTGRAFAWQHWGVRPDILVLGKAMSAGYYPASAIVVAEHVVAPLRERGLHFENGQTFVFNPMSAVIGAHVIARLREDDLISRGAAMAARFRRRLEDLREHRVIGDVRGLGLLIGIELVRNADTGEMFDMEERVAEKFAEAALRSRLVVYPGRGSPGSMRGDHILLFPPLTIGEPEIDHAVGALASAARELDRISGAAPGPLSR